MKYRRLGRTNLHASVLGVGGGYLMLLERKMGTRLYERAYDLGLNYFDGRYGDSSAMLRPVLQRGRERCVMVSKTAEASADGGAAPGRRGTGGAGHGLPGRLFPASLHHEMLQERLAPSGAFDGLAKAREQGKIRFMGLANHSDPVVLVTPANEHDRAQVAALAEQIQEATGDSVEVAFVDQGYTDDQPAADAQVHGIRLEVASCLRLSVALCCSLAAGWWNVASPGWRASVDWPATTSAWRRPWRGCISWPLPYSWRIGSSLSWSKVHNTL